MFYNLLACYHDKPALYLSHTRIKIPWQPCIKVKLMVVWWLHWIFVTFTPLSITRKLHRWLQCVTKQLRCISGWLQSLSDRWLTIASTCYVVNNTDILPIHCNWSLFYSILQQSLWDNTAINCDKSAKIANVGLSVANLVPSTQIEIHIK